MKKYIFIGAYLCLVFLPIDLYAADDSQYWNSVNVKKVVDNKWSFHINLVQKMVERMGTLGLWNCKPGITYNFSQFFSLSTDYQYELLLNGNSWRKEHRIDLVPRLKFLFGNFNIDLQSKIENRHIEETRIFRFREKFILSREYVFNSFKFKPVLSQEVYYTMDYGGWDQLRTQFGFTTPLTNHIQVLVFYLLKQSKGETGWKKYHALGTGFSIKV